MPPKAKAVQKQRDKIVEEKTFGLKNKNKSKKVQQYVHTVATSVQAAGMSRKEAQMLEARKKERELAKVAKEQQEKEMGELFKTIVKQTVVPAGVDPKSVVCEYFKQGKCNRGDKCKYSHNVEVARKVSKIDLYSDPRKLDLMEQWDQSKLESVVAQKDVKRPNETQIVCKYFLEAIEKKKYGWFWECPNGAGCIYQHRLPPGYVLKEEKAKGGEDQEEDEGPTLEEQIEIERKQLNISVCTPVTPESFAQWKEMQKQKRKDQQEEKRAQEAKKTGSRGLGVLSGKALFEFDPSLFVDDEDAVDDSAYEERTNEEEAAEQAEEEEEEEDGDHKESTGAVDEGLFLDDEGLPDVQEDDEDEDAAH